MRPSDSYQIELLHAGLGPAALGAAIHHVGGGVVAVEEGRHRMVKNAGPPKVTHRIADPDTRRSDHCYANRNYRMKARKRLPVLSIAR